jgi:hypothetical protein
MRCSTNRRIISYQSTGHGKGETEINGAHEIITERSVLHVRGVLLFGRLVHARQRIGFMDYFPPAPNGIERGPCCILSTR